MMASTNVFVGRWTDYSLTGVNREVLTLSVRDGALLIAALSTFVGLVGTAFWTLAAFCIHQCSARETAQDGFYFQQQAIYRNAGTPTAALLDTFKMCWAWRKPRRQAARIAKLKSRSIILALPALLIFVGFTTSGIFVGKVAGKAYSSNDVLVKPGKCGWFTYNQQTIQGTAAFEQRLINDTLAARAYATTCYDNTTIAEASASCGQYTLLALPWSADNVTCPFGQDPHGDSLCLPAQNTAYQLSTPALDSNDVFGINAPDQDRITVSKRLTCAPLHVKNYTTSQSAGSFDTYYVNLGPLIDVTNYTYGYKSQLQQLSVGYQITSAYPGDGSSSGTWQPVAALQVPTGDLNVHFMTPNSISYLTPVDDIFFAAHDPFVLDDTETLYLSDNYIYVMGCVDQYQICNPSTTPQSCTIQGKITQMTAAVKQIGLNQHQYVTALRFILALEASNTYFTVNSVGSSALLAHNRVTGTTISTGLPVGQWQIEVEGWFKTSLAKLQAYVVEYVSNTADLGPYGAVVSVSTLSNNTYDKAATQMCTQQRIRNTGGYQTFSFFGLMIIVCVGLSIILLSWIVEPLVGVYRHLRRTGSNDYKEIARIADKTFQLQRMALNQGRENDRWEKNMTEVPVTIAETTFMPATRTRVGGNDDYRYEHHGYHGWPLMEVQHEPSKPEF